MAGAAPAFAAFVAAALLAGCAAASFTAVKLALQKAAGDTSEEASGTGSTRSAGILLVLSGVAAIGVDSFVEVVTLPILAHAAEGEFSVMLFFARPVLGFATTAALFPLLRRRTGSSACRLSAGGLALLSVPWAAAASQLEPGFWMGVCYHVGAVASALVKVPILHTLLQAGSSKAGWRACAAFYGVLLGPAFSGWLSSAALKDPLMPLLVITAVAAGAAQLAMAEVPPRAPEPEDLSAAFLSEDAGHLLAGVSVATLLLSVQGALVPLLLRSSPAGGESMDTISVLLTGGGLLLAAPLARRLPPRGAVLALALASLAAVLGMRSLVTSLAAARPGELAFARLALQAALGGLLGLAVSLPTRIRFAAAPATAGALRSCGIAAAGFFGEGLGLTLQLLLLPILGAQLTLSAMALAPLLYAFVLVLRLPRAASTKIEEDEISAQLDQPAVEGTTYVRGANAAGKVRADGH